jgi:hypothetical protein
LQELTAYWAKTSFDFGTPSVTEEKPLDVKQRIAAGGLGALSFHSAIVLYNISYTTTPEIGSITLKAAGTAAVIVLYWTLISCLLFSGYNRKADFSHVFRASLLFNVFIYTVGRLESAVALRFFPLG